MASRNLISVTQKGLYCLAGDFYIDPWEPVERAVITHAHADHARPGSGEYLCADPGAGVLRRRMGPDAEIAPVPFGEEVDCDGVRISFHPAGHVLGSAQIRVRAGGETWVVSGDFKRQSDPTCRPFETVACDVLVTEATFGLPIYQWRPTAEVIDELVSWWDAAAEARRPALLGCYAFGKAQRVLAELSTRTDRTVWVHGAIHKLNADYRAAGVSGLDRAAYVGDAPDDQDWAGKLVLGTPGALGSRWTKRFKKAELALISGWMRVRGNRRWQSYDRGFALSDHADWPALLETVAASGADKVLVTHGSSEALARYLREEQGIDASPLDTRYEGEGEH